MASTHRRLACVLILGVILSCSGCGCDSSVGFRLPEPAIRYVAFGDSATRGPSDKDYVDFLPESLGAPQAQFANEGKSGETSGAGLDRLQTLASRRIFPNAEVLLYWEGGNDVVDFMQEVDPLFLLSPDTALYPYSKRLTETLDDVQANIEAAIRVGKGAGMQVFVATYFNLKEFSLNCDMLLLDVLLPAQADNANVYVTMLNDRIRQAAANEGAVLVDVAAQAAALQADPANYFNCNHLSDRGNEIVARVFLDSINK